MKSNPTNLPAGYNDPESFYFVPEEFRSAWEQFADELTLADTCPVCGGVEGGTPKNRPLAVGETVTHARRPQPTDAAIPSLTSCIKCFMVAVALYQDRWAAEPTVGGATRANTVADVLTKQLSAGA